MTRWIPVHLTEFQLVVVRDALDLYAEGAQGQQTQREVREARAANKKVRAAITHSTEPAYRGAIPPNAAERAAVRAQLTQPSEPESGEVSQ